MLSLVILWLPSGSHSSWMSLDNHEHSTFHLKECLIGHEAQPALRGQLGRGMHRGDVSLESSAICWPNPSWIPGVDNPGCACEPQRVLSRLRVFCSGLLSSFSCSVCFHFLMWAVCLSVWSPVQCLHRCAVVCQGQGTFSPTVMHTSKN